MRRVSTSNTSDIMMKCMGNGVDLGTIPHSEIEFQLQENSFRINRTHIK